MGIGTNANQRGGRIPTFEANGDYTGSIPPVYEDTNMVLPTDGYEHLSVTLPLAFAPQYSDDVRVNYSYFNTRNATHRLTLTKRPFGHWLQENFVGPFRTLFYNDPTSPNGVKEPAPYLQRSRQNIVRPQSVSAGDLAGPRHGRGTP